MGTISFSTSYFFLPLHWVKRGKEAGGQQSGCWGAGTTALPGAAGATLQCHRAGEFLALMGLFGYPALAWDAGGDLPSKGS